MTIKVNKINVFAVKFYLYTVKLPLADKSVRIPPPLITEASSAPRTIFLTFVDFLRTVPAKRLARQVK